MEIIKLTELDIPKLVSYGEKIFPERRSYYSSLLNFYFKGRMNGLTGALAIIKDGEICGQTFHLETTMWFQNKKIVTCWGLDLIIDEDLREEAGGIDLILTSKKHYPNSAAVGSGDLALKINLKMGFKWVGEVRKYVGISSIPMLPIYLFCKKNKFPQAINDFFLVSNKESFRATDYFNKDIIEIGRDNDFISWRYFTPEFRKYFVYQNKSGLYFVVRPIRYKGIRMLALIDFRCDLSVDGEFKAIFETVRKLAKRMLFPFMLCGSSHRTIDSVLEKNGMKSIGRPRPIIIRNELKKSIDEDRVNKRDFVFVTLADSDGEVSWN